MRLDIEIDKGFVKEMERTMKDLDKKIQKKINVKALHACADVLREGVRKGVESHVKSSESTGTRLSWSAKVREKRSGKSLTRKSSIIKQRRNFKGAIFINVGPKEEFFYAKFIEQGTDTHKLWTRKRGSGAAENRVSVLPPRPFMMPAFKATSNKAINAFKQTFRREFASAVRQIKVR